MLWTVWLWFKRANDDGIIWILIRLLPTMLATSCRSLKNKSKSGRLLAQPTSMCCIVRCTGTLYKRKICTHNVCSTASCATFHFKYWVNYWEMNIDDPWTRYSAYSMPKNLRTSLLLFYVFVCFTVPAVKFSMATTRDYGSQSKLGNGGLWCNTWLTNNLLWNQ